MRWQRRTKMEEIWKDVPGFEGLYQASTEGNIRSLNYNGQKGVVKNLTPVRCGAGNYRVGLFDKNKKKKMDLKILNIFLKFHNCFFSIYDLIWNISIFQVFANVFTHIPY